MSNATIDLDELEQLGKEQDEDTDLIRTLRAKIRDAARHVKDRNDLETEVRTLKLDKTVRDAELGDLNETQRETLAQWAERQDEVSAETLRERAVALGWAEAKPDPAATEIQAHDAISDATNGAPPRGGQVIAPTDINGWSMEKRLRFRRDHPDAWEQLSRGESVAGVTV